LTRIEKEAGAIRLPTISVVVCTRDRPKDLVELLHALLDQTYPPFEVIVVDASLSNRVQKLVDSFQSKFHKDGLRYIKARDDGLPAARNLGVRLSNGDAILFLDDDTLLENNLLDALAIFLHEHPNAIGIQPQVHGLFARPTNGIKRKIKNTMYKAFMLNYYKQNTLSVRKSGLSGFPYSYPLTEEANAQRLDGCCMCYRREIFEKLSFDTNLKRWAFMEDLDFSYRAYKKNLGTLHAIPSAIITHKKSTKSRLPSRERTYMTTIYWFYVFFKDVLEGSILNLLAFLWALAGNLVTMVVGLLVERRSKPAWWNLVYLSHSYAVAFANLKAVINGDLGFFNKSLNGQGKVEDK